MNPKVDAYIARNEKWQKELGQLRKIVLDCELTEELKWGVPCYTLQNHNVVLMHVFKEYCAILFPKGALLHDPEGILIQQTENTQAARQIRFTGVKDIVRMAPAIKTYIYEAIQVEQAGLKVAFKKSTEFSVPIEFKDKLDEVPGLKAAFEALTPGRQRAYLLHFSSAKQSRTRTARVEKYMQHILAGKGLDD